MLALFFVYRVLGHGLRELPAPGLVGKLVPLALEQLWRIFVLDHQSEILAQHEGLDPRAAVRLVAGFLIKRLQHCRLYCE